MAFVLTYNNLLTLIPSYLERSDQDVIDNIPIFVELAQRRISKDVKQLGLTTYLVGAFTPSVGVYAKPAKWSNALSFNFGSGEGNNTITQLQLRPYEFCIEYWKDLSATDTPKYYADYGYSHWLIVPTPAVASPFEVAFMGMSSTIDETQQTNWVTQFAPEMLIYASLMEAQIYLKNDQRTAYFEDLYTKALQSLTSEDKARYTDRYSQRQKD